MSANRSNRQIAGIVSLLALSSFTLFGCGGGDSPTTIADTPTRAVIAATPTNIDIVGGTTTYTLDINQAINVDPATVMINVENGNPFLAVGGQGIGPAPLDPTSDAYIAQVNTVISDKSSNSYTDGPQLMTPVPGVKNRFTYSHLFPAPSARPYGPTVAYYTAKDTQGKPIHISVTDGMQDRNFSPSGATLSFTPVSGK